MAVYSDNFDRADDPTGLGALWSVTLAQTGPTYSISGNACKQPADGQNMAVRYDAELTSPDSSVEADVTADVAGTGLVGVTIRGNSATAHCYRAALTASQQKAQLQYVDGSGTVTTLGTWPVAISAGVARHVKLTAAGSTITMAVDGGGPLSATDTHLAGGTYAGISGYGNSNGTATIDNWVAYPAPAPPPPSGPVPLPSAIGVAVAVGISA